jgi:DNA-binding response OmpR family regulator
MPSLADPVGTVLLRTGALTEEALEDALDQQQRTMPLESLCYILGYLDEETLALGLSRHFGMPAVVLEQSVVALEVLAAVSRETALRHNVLPVHEDDHRIFVAVEDPGAVSEVLREIRFTSGKTPVVHVALHITLARSVRACYAARERGERYHAGPQADLGPHPEPGYMATVADIRSSSEDVSASPLAGSVVEDVTRELEHHELRMLEDQEPTRTIETEPLADPDTTMNTMPGKHVQMATFDGATDVSAMAQVPDRDSSSLLDLDAGEGAGYHAGHSGPGRVLIVDDDFATRHLLVKVLQPQGLLTATAATGSEAIRHLTSSPPDVVILDVMLPEMDGFQLCRAIKESRKYSDIAVILISAGLGSEPISDEVLAGHGADGYFEKPLDTDRLREHVSGLLRALERSAPAGEDDSFERAIDLYKSGDIDGAIDNLRAGLEVDPLSAKHHFVLANLLQTQSLLYEAIDEYEATVELKPDYFPALTRLAYLYHRQGFAAKAVEVWRRSLPFCPDPSLRQNIERFIARLTDEMKSQP